ncbi:cytochrome P450, partial [Rhizopogon vinicolor AM-OR11-026]
MNGLEIAYAVSSPFGAGIEMVSFFFGETIFVMLNPPHVMRKVLNELDNVIGFDHVPEFYVKERLPYIKALIDETLRWRPVAVLGGTPHAVTQDGEYQVMFIPKGSTVFANLAGIMHNLIMFPHPDNLCPERFLEIADSKLQTFDLPFEWGRRICPGMYMYLSLNSLFIDVSCILWAFNITPAIDGTEVDILADSMNYTNRFNSRPVSFNCTVAPRSGKVTELLIAEYEETKA